jgi:hypothetical protein
MSRLITARCLPVAVLAAWLVASCGGGSDAPAPLVIGAAAPSGTTAAAYPAFSFTVMSGGLAPYSWSETGALPPGLSLSPSGQLSGTPTSAGSYPIVVTVTDSSNPPRSATTPVSLAIADSPILISMAPVPPAGTANCTYAGFEFAASGGSPGYTWTLTAGHLPAGLTLSPNGSLSGTPTSTGPYAFTVTATDSAQTPEAKSQPFTITVNPPANPPINTPVNALGGGGAFWIPYTSTAVSSSCGASGVFVIPSNALTTAPTYVTTSASTMFLASGQNVTVNGSDVVTAYSPATLMFAATDTSDNIHVYGLNLVSASTPTATQISSLSLPLASGAPLNTVICDSHSSSGNLLQPTTLFVVLHIAGATGCNTSGDIWEVVHYTDSSATAPTVVSIATTNIQELYAPSGALAGLMLLDPASNNLYVYADAGFTAPASAIPGGGIGSIRTIFSNNDVFATGTAFTGTVLFLAVTTTGGTQFLYRLPYTSTTATNEYTTAGGLNTLGAGVSDGTNLYFTDDDTPQLILQEPLAGGTPTKLYSNTNAVRYSLVGSNGSLLVMFDGYLVTLPVGTLSSATTFLANGGNFGSFMVQTTPGTPSTALVFVSTKSFIPYQRRAYTSEVLTPSGTAGSVASNSSFLYDGTSGLSGYVLQVGASFWNLPWKLRAINLHTLAATNLQTPADAAFTVSAGGKPQLAGLSNVIGAGTYQGRGLAYDLSKNLIVPIDIPNTNVAPL